MRYRQPNNEDAFEEFCLVLLREHWSLPTLDRYGRRGERQHGVDLLDTGGGTPLRAAQCKHHDPTKTLPPRELQAEVDKAKGFPEKLGEFHVLTTAKKSVHAQRKVREINKDHAAKGLFVVRLLTWDDVERTIDECPTGQEFLGIQAPQAMRLLLRAELQPVQAALGAQGDDAHGAELDEVKRHLNEGQVPIAGLLLGRLRNKSWDRMSARHRYRWCTLFADAELRQGNDSRAAQLLIEAKGYQPDDDDAVSNEIMAYELLGSRAKAHELALAAVAARPHSASIYAGALRTVPSREEFARLFDGRPDHLKEHPELWAAAATRDDVATSIDDAEQTARHAVSLAPDDARGWFALGGLLLRSEFGKVDPEGAPHGAPVRARIEEARSCLTKVIELSAGRGMPGFQATALIRRATATAYVGDVRAAHQDIQEARRVAPADTAVLVATARMEEERGNHAEGVQLLRQVVMRHQDDEARFLLGISLWNRNAPGDRVEAVDILARVGVEGTLHVEPANELAVDGMIVQGRHAEARLHLESVASRLDSCLGATSMAKIEIAAGRADEASARATEATTKISPQTSRATLRKLGKLLVSLGRLADSLPVWERLVVTGEVNDETRSLVECAGRLGRDSKVLEVCAAARKADVFDEFLLQWELRLLDRYDPETALAVLNEFIRREPTNKHARLHMVHLSLRLGKTELATAQLALLPVVTEVDAEEGAAVVAALSKLGRSAEAMEYAYDLLRRHFQDHHAHRAFRDAVMFREQPAEPETPTEAGPGIAVCLTEDGARAPQWFVLEDSAVEASGVEDEIRPDSALGRKLLGKKLGDEVALSEGAGVRRAAVVRELVPKRVFRARDVWDRWQYRFPEHQEMWMVRVAKSDDDDKPDFSSLFELAKEQHRRHQEAEALYTSKLIPIRPFGEAIGKTEIYAVGHITGSDDMMLRCCIGSADEYAEAVNAINAAAEIVLDVTAVTTLMMLDELSVLDALGKTALITHSTMAAVREFVEQARTHARSVGSMGANEDGPILFVASPEGKRASLDAAERALKAIEEKCRVVGCPGLAEVDPGDRRLMEQGIGSSALESAIVGAGAGRVLWTDDGVTAQLVREKFGTKRVWTQGVLRTLNEQGVIANDRYAQASARLLGWRYMFTSVNPEVMRSAGNQAEWRPERSPLKQTLSYLSLDAVRSQDAAFLSAMLVVRCYLETVLPETRRVLLQATAETLAKRSDAEHAVPLFGTLLTRAFGLNVAAQHDAVQTFEAWRREHLRRFSPVRR